MKDTLYLPIIISAVVIFVVAYLIGFFKYKHIWSPLFYSKSHQKSINLRNNNSINNSQKKSYQQSRTRSLRKLFSKKNSRNSYEPSSLNPNEEYRVWV
jgi:hypothetical protein